MLRTCSSCKLMTIVVMVFSFCVAGVAQAAYTPPAPVSLACVGNSGAVSIINIQNGAVLASPSIGSSALYSVAMSPAGNFCYASGFGGAVSRINLADSTVMNGNGSYNFHWITVSTDGSKLYAASRDGSTVEVFSTADLTPVTTINGFSNPTGVAVSPDGAKVYVANYNSGTISEISTGDNSVATVATGISTPYGVVVSPDSKKVYVASAAGTVTVIDTSNSNSIQTIPLSSMIVGIALSPDGRFLYTANYGAGSVSVIRTSDTSVISTVTTGGSPEGISVTPDGTRVYVAIGSAVKVIRTTDYGVESTLPVTTSHSVGQFTMPALPVYAANYGTPAVTAHNSQNSGNIAPAVNVAGAATGFNGTNGVFAHGNEIFVANHNGNNVSVYSAYDTGNAAPLRTLQSGTNSGNNWPTQLFIDSGELYVTNFNSDTRVFNLTDSGDVAPKRVVSTLTKTYGIAVYGNELFLSRHPNSGDGDTIYVFPKTQNSGVAAVRSISGANTGLSFVSGIHVSKDEIFVSSYFNNSIRVFNLNDSGNSAAKRTIEGTLTQLNTPLGIWVSDNEIFVGNRGDNSILVFNVSDSGNVAPKRIIKGSASGLSQPMQVMSPVLRRYNPDFEVDPVNTAGGGITDWEYQFYTYNDFGTRGTSPTATHTLETTGARSFSGQKSVYSTIQSFGGTNNWDADYHYATHAMTTGYLKQPNINLAAITIWRSDISYTTSSRWFHWFAMDLNDGVNSQTVMLACRAWGLNEGCSNNYENTSDQTATGTDGQTWYRHRVAVPPEFDQNKLKITIRHVQRSWDGTSASSNLYYDLLGEEVVDTTPGAFTFASISNVFTSTAYESGAVTVTDISAAAPISIVGGQYAVSRDGGTNWGGWTSVAGTANLNDQIKVMLISSVSAGTKTTVTLSVGGITGDFDVTTSSTPVALLLPVSGLVSLWRAENNALDSFGNNHGTLKNGATFAAGKYGQALSLNGANSYVEVPDSPTLTISGDFSVSLWTNYTAISAGLNVFVGHDQGGGALPKWAFLSQDGNLQLHINGTNPVWVGVPFSPQTGNWYHLSVTRSGPLFTFYVNGISAGTVTDSTAIADVSAPLTIGQVEGLGFFNGLIDEVAIYSRALTSDEVAKTAGISYAMVYSGNGSNSGSIPIDSSSPYQPGATVTVLGNSGGLARTGYSFSVWNTAADGSGTDYANTAVFVISADTTLYAKWTLNSYTVSFNSNGGSAVTSQSIDYNTTATAPAAPGKTGYTFAGWYSDAALTAAFTFTTAITADTTLYAKWTINSYTVSFNSNGGSAVTSQSVDYNALAAAPAAPTKTGSTFSGWYSDVALTTAFAFTTPISADTTLYAKWTLNSYTITPTAGTGSSISPATAQTITSGATTSFTVAPLAGFGILSVTGCNGTLNGSSYTTAAITANCTVSVTAVKRNGNSGSAADPTVADALKAMQAYVGLLSLTPEQHILYDVAPLSTSAVPQGNGVVDVADVIMILRRAVGIGSW
ncbi:MAG TPA: beta-propeller fold lactonase family protein [Desulfuromonadales bacterium]|nr:beta-propeller fold lactonase family protein [Desulfuromonadales bacterium]